MMSLAVMDELSRRSARKARQAKRYPRVLSDYELENLRRTRKSDVFRFPFPNIGDWRPRGWSLVDQLFCDSTGWGSASEPALTIDQLLDKLEPGFAYAIIQEGQFQLYLGKFRLSPCAYKKLDEIDQYW